MNIGTFEIISLPIPAEFIFHPSDKPSLSSLLSDKPIMPKHFLHHKPMSYIPLTFSTLFFH